MRPAPTGRSFRQRAKIKAETSLDKPAKGGAFGASAPGCCAGLPANLCTAAPGASKPGQIAALFQLVTEGLPTTNSICRSSERLFRYHNKLDFCLISRQTGRAIVKIGLRALRSAVLHRVIHRRRGYRRIPMRRFCGVDWIGSDARLGSAQRRSGPVPRIGAAASRRAAISAATLGTTCTRRRVFAEAKPRSTMWSSSLRKRVQ